MDLSVGVNTTPIATASITRAAVGTSGGRDSTLKANAYISKTIMELSLGIGETRKLAIPLRYSC
jgi:hypothetical protein